MDEDEVKDAIAQALEGGLEDCEVYVKPAGVLIAFMDGSRWLLRPLDVSERDEDDSEPDDESEEEE